MTTIMPPVTVLMPVYNGERYLKQAIESILRQSFEEYEFLIINDGSNDKSEEIIRSFEDSRIKYVKNEKNLGLVKTLNKGIKMAKSEYIVRMDCDDISLNDRVEKQVKYMDEHKDVAACGSWANTIDENNRVIGELKALTGYLLEKFYWRPSPIIHPSAIIRKKYLSELLFDEKYIYAEDYELWLRLIKRYKLANISQKLLSYRIHGGSVSVKNRELQISSSYEAYKRSFPTSKMSIGEYKKIAFYNDEIGFKERLSLLYKIKNEIGLPLSLIWADNCLFLIRRFIKS